MDPDKDIKFTMIRTHRDPLSRQIEGSLRINWGLQKGVVAGTRNSLEPAVCLNRREEAFAPRLRYKDPGISSK